MHRSTGLVLALLLLAGLPALQAAPQGQDWRRVYSQNIESDDSWVRVEAVQAVNPSSQDGVRVLMSLLAGTELHRVDWWVRHHVIEKLAQVSGDRPRSLLLRGLEARQDRVREGIVLALGRRGDARDLERVLDMAEDRSPRVQRAVAMALAGWPPAPEAVETTLALWEEQDDATSRVGHRCRATLSELLDRNLGLDPEPWRTLWDDVADDYPAIPEPGAEEEDEPEEGGTRARGVPLEYTESGEGDIPLLVIPDDHFTPSFYRPYLEMIEDVCRVYYMELPPVTAFPSDEVEHHDSGIPYYPVDRLVEAFDALREEEGIERFALMAHGFNTLVAQRYLTLHPERVSHVILMGGVSGNQAWGRIIDGIQSRGQANGDLEMRHAARNMKIYPDGSHDYEPESEDEEDALDRKRFTLYFADGNDPMIHRFWTEHHEEEPEEEESISPDFATGRQAEVPVPMLCQFGAQSLWTIRADAEVFTDHYPRAITRFYEESAMCPFVEQPVEWSRDVHAFFEQFPEGGRR